MQTKQEQEAKAFAEANESRIAAIRGRLMDAGAAFMRTSIASQLPAMVARKANECCQSALKTFQVSASKSFQLVSCFSRPFSVV